MSKRRPRERSKRNPAASERSKLLWQDPAYREKVLAKRQAIIDAKPKSERHSRVGVPNGMRRPHAKRLWGVARKQAKRFIKIMEDNGELEKVVIPGSDADMAKRALAEAFTLAVGPNTEVKTKIAALKVVLDFTKEKPVSKQKLTLDKSEEWLAALEAEMKSDGSGQAGDPSPSA